MEIQAVAALMVSTAMSVSGCGLQNNEQFILTQKQLKV